MNIFEEKLNIYPPVLFQLLLALMREGGREGGREREMAFICFFLLYLHFSLSFIYNPNLSQSF
jgi:hypothetical protein